MQTHRPIGPFAGQMDAGTGDDCRLVQKAHCRQVQAISSHEIAGLSQVFARCVSTCGVRWCGVRWCGVSQLS